jgi:hypothetical protein
MNTIEKQLQGVRDEVLKRATCCDPVSPAITTTCNIMHVMCELCGRYFTTFVASSMRATGAAPEPPLTIHRKTQSIEAWALEVGVTTKMIRRRLRQGEFPEDAVFKPCRRRHKVPA